MCNYVLLTDSTADLPAEILETMEIVSTPLSFILGGKEHPDLPDGGAVSVRDFYNALRDGKRSQTSQINEHQFVDVFEANLKEGKDVLYLAFSSRLSGTCFQAKSAAEKLNAKYPDRKVVVIDTLCASMGEGLLVYETAKLRKNGASLEEAADFAEKNLLHLCHWFTVDDLNHLKRGGRVSSAAALVGTMLGIKPILHVDNEGQLIPVSKVRGRGKSLEELVEQMKKTAINPKTQTVFISHGDSYDDAKKVADMVTAAFGITDIVIAPVGPVIGSHAGPGTIALFFFGTER